MKVNFFWKGNDFKSWDYLCLKSHLKVNHEIVIWLSGEQPQKTLWNDLIKHKNVSIENANDIINIDKFISDGGNFQTASALFRFKLLYYSGGWYADTDAFAVQSWEDITESWIVASAEENRQILSIGVIKAPAFSPVFLLCLNNIKHNWGNVKMFDKMFNTTYKHWTPNIKNEEWYPWTWKNYNMLFENDSLNNFKKNNIRSIHLYSTMLKRNNIVYGKQPYDCLLNDMIKWVDE